MAALRTKLGITRYPDKVCRP